MPEKKTETPEPNANQRHFALQLAVEVGRTAGWRQPGTTTLVHAHEFAGFLADGTLPDDVKKILGMEEGK